MCSSTILKHYILYDEYVFKRILLKVRLPSYDCFTLMIHHRYKWKHEIVAAAKLKRVTWLLVRLEHPIHFIYENTNRRANRSSNHQNHPKAATPNTTMDRRADGQYMQGAGNMRYNYSGCMEINFTLVFLIMLSTDAAAVAGAAVMMVVWSDVEQRLSSNNVLFSFLFSLSTKLRMLADSYTDNYGARQAWRGLTYPAMCGY